MPGCTDSPPLKVHHNKKKYAPHEGGNRAWYNAIGTVSERVGRPLLVILIPCRGDSLSHIGSMRQPLGSCRPIWVWARLRLPLLCPPTQPTYPPPLRMRHFQARLCRPGPPSDLAPTWVVIDGIKGYVNALGAAADNKAGALKDILQEEVLHRVREAGDAHQRACT